MDLSLTTRTVHVPNREWLAEGTKHTAFGGTLDVAGFIEADHYPNGYLLDGIVVALVASTGLFVPYDAANVDEDDIEIARGILFSPVNVGDNNPSAAIMVAGFIFDGRLPSSGDMTGGGWDAAAAAGPATGAHLILDVDRD